MKGYKGKVKTIDLYLKSISLKQTDTIERINQKLKGYLALVDEKFKGNDFNHKWRCNCNETFIKRWRNIRSRSEFKCKKFIRKEVEMSYKKIVEAFEGCKLIKVYFKGDILPNLKRKKSVGAEIEIMHSCGNNETILLKKFINRKVKCLECKIPYEKTIAYYIIEVLKKKLDDIWCLERNEGLDPYKLSMHSNEYAMLKCKKGVIGHQPTMRRISDFYKNKGCYYCGNEYIEKEKSFGFLMPEIANMIIDDVDIYKIGIQSNKKYNFRCDTCGNIISKNIANIYNQGFTCPECSDNKWITEKFMFRILKNLNMNFDYQKKFSWSKNKIYDFYLQDYNTILEIDGEQHVSKNKTWGKMNYIDIKKNDKMKEMLAYENNINIIRIQAYKSDFKYLKNSYITGLKKISKEIPLDNIDYNKLWEESQKSLVKEIWNLWSRYENTKKIVDITKLSRVTVINYLKRGNKLGIIRYSSYEEMKKSARKNWNVYRYEIKTMYGELINFDTGSLLVKSLKLKKGILGKIIKNNELLDSNHFREGYDSKYLGAEIVRKDR